MLAGALEPAAEYLLLAGDISLLSDWHKADAFWDFSLRTGIMRGVNMRIHRAAFRLHLNILFDKRFVGAVTLETVVLQHGTGLNGCGKDGSYRETCQSQVHDPLQKWADGPPEANRRP